MKDISAKLKARREELGYCIEDIVEKTKLHPSALRDIEEGNLSDISPAYLRGFLRIYAKFLGVDIEADLKNIPSAQNIDKKQKTSAVKIPVQKPVVTPPKAPVVPVASSRNSSPMPKTIINIQGASSGNTPVPAQKPWVKPHASVQEAPEGKGGPKFIFSWPILKKIVITVICIFVLAALFKGVPTFMQKLKTDHAAAVQKANIKKAQYERRRAADKEKKRLEKEKRLMEKKRIQAKKDADRKAKELQAAQEKTRQEKQEREEEALAAVSLPSIKSTITVSLTTKKDCFVRANVDKKVLFEGVLRKGVAETWKAKKEIDLKLSDGSAVIIEVNGTVIPPLTTGARAIKSLKINSKGITVNK